MGGANSEVAKEWKDNNKQVTLIGVHSPMQLVTPIMVM